MPDKREIPYGYEMRSGSLKRMFMNLLLMPAWFFPWKKARVFFHRMRGVNIGKNVEIGYMVLLDNRRPELITIEDKVFITAMSIVLTHDLSQKNINGKEIVGEVIIREGAFIGMNSIILPGVTIGKKCIIGAGTVISKNTEDNSVYIGAQARQIT
jgi:acetyltransferase-like isoleucine patch superfamily enzyme